jgi:hypothetical protein
MYAVLLLKFEVSGGVTMTLMCSEFVLDMPFLVLVLGFALSVLLSPLLLRWLADFLLPIVERFESDSCCGPLAQCPALWNGV